jgi:hypothetical protein
MDGMSIYGRSDDEWDVLADACEEFLRILASDDEHRLLPVKSTADQRLKFWSDQVTGLFDYYG